MGSTVDKAYVKAYERATPPLTDLKQTREPFDAEEYDTVIYPSPGDVLVLPVLVLFVYSRPVSACGIGASFLFYSASNFPHLCCFAVTYFAFSLAVELCC